MRAQLFSTVIIFFLSITTAFANVVLPADSLPIKLKQPNVLNVISYSEFKPISYGQGEGYEADMLRAIAKLWGVEIKFYPENIYQGIWRSPSRTYTIADIAIGGLSPNEDRIKEGAHFSIISTVFNQSLLVRKEDYLSGRIIDYRSFKDTHMKIGVVPSTTGEHYAYVRAKEQKFPIETIVAYTSEADLLPALLNGEIDAIARGEIGNDYQATSNKNLVTIARRNFGEGFAFAIDSSNKLLIEKMNQAIRIVTDCGRITYAHWLKNKCVFWQHVVNLSR
ncbi:MAG TPA: transporter substrate-binding domain-containing protein [Gammaproteobacteria bacterium]|nr:transporter substrate-binding domain-containing protein [Gammaproteobacteria bacterium]